MPETHFPELEISVLVPVRPAPDVINQIKEESLGIFSSRRGVPDEIGLVYKPYYRLKVCYSLDPKYGRQIEGEHEAIVDGMSGIAAVLQPGSTLRIEPRRVSRGAVVKPQVLSEKVGRAASDYISKMFYQKYQHFPQCLPGEPELFYRGFYILEWTKGRKYRKQIVAADPYELQGKSKRGIFT